MYRNIEANHLSLVSLTFCVPEAQQRRSKMAFICCQFIHQGLQNTVFVTLESASFWEVLILNYSCHSFETVGLKTKGCHSVNISIAWHFVAHSRTKKTKQEISYMTFER